ncbi:MAG: T9SS type A sorting domain-containing protein, partial [Cyclobacteriaceae bacterium]|nr:T9SS type A sorting domain-containing protein [Cyclobacteriaceae bacterium]
SILYQKSGSTLATTAYKENYFPNSDRDWRNEFIRLTDYSGLNNVRIAIKVVNGTGNNLHLDNIEFFGDDNPIPVTIAPGVSAAYPNPTLNKRFKLTFNLPEHEIVFIRIYDSIGRLIYQKEVKFVLNQTYEFHLPDAEIGMYYIKIQSNSINGTNRLIIR